jgi:hypothetical protein
MPDAIQKWVFVGDVVPVLYCVIDVASMMVEFVHYLRALVPDLLAVATSIKEMFFGFLLLIVEDAEGWSNEASFPEVVPG